MTLPPTAIPATTLEDDERAAQRRLRRRRNLIVTLRIAVLVIVLGGWELAARLKWIDPFFFSMPSLIFEQIQDWFVNGTSQGPLLTQVWVTLEETGIGFVIGSVAGVICGIVLGRNKLMADVFGLYIQIANSIPRVVLGSIFVIALGLGMASKIALAVVMVFFVVFGNAFQGVREADRYLIANAQILGASRRQITTAVVIPSALSWILASLHVSFGFALVGAVVGEFLGSKQGIGLLISTAQGAFNASGVFAAMIVLAVVALAADYLLTWLEKRLLKWRPAAF
ncbi:binding-protein-dependent transport systems inner membrane protein [Burkholderia lata]|uniref:Binding-protein-dependent transport systems inner membrane protein n=4 Tax=Burkholderiaceae TaxID=119060 RepID=A0A6J5J5Y3_9BURK|nr:binding-protein-dependent transport systems inner membrane protein [Burkholderia aenigmatica]VWB83688.1 binding-protein-dependent transport systems inner membrane protein [Burkholderia lata]VWC04418.1 binding-protein-dependent transport systems inner membrane protein [Burkholderia lata]VWC80853.1 binding-protein-dependent transport systems inner membrane protein [Burkholderia aenigmatica]VWD20854.1 binding-protein-dependent transport systems inner membrane protein [Burkholderia lata]